MQLKVAAEATAQQAEVMAVLSDVLAKTELVDVTAEIATCRGAIAKASSAHVQLWPGAVVTRSGV